MKAHPEGVPQPAPTNREDWQAESAADSKAELLVEPATLHQHRFQLCLSSVRLLFCSQERPKDMRTTFLLLLAAIGLFATGCITLTGDQDDAIEDSAPVLIEEKQFEKQVAKFEEDIISLRKENQGLRTELDALKKALKTRRPLTRGDLERLVQTMVDAESGEMAARLEAARAERIRRKEREERESGRVDGDNPADEEVEDIEGDPEDKIEEGALETP